MPTFTDVARRRFIERVRAYTDAVVQQSFDREHALVRDVDGYFAVRRGTSGVEPVVTLNQAHLSLPDRVVGHDVVRQLERITTDLVIVSNDLFSYNVECVWARPVFPHTHTSPFPFTTPSSRSLWSDIPWLTFGYDHAAYLPIDKVVMTTDTTWSPS